MPEIDFQLYLRGSALAEYKKALTDANLLLAVWSSSQSEGPAVAKKLATNLLIAYSEAIFYLVPSSRSQVYQILALDSTRGENLTTVGDMLNQYRQMIFDANPEVKRAFQNYVTSADRTREEVCIYLTGLFRAIPPARRCTCLVLK
jgi:hypothetical protein